jgi:hypothetical protein
VSGYDDWERGNDQYLAAAIAWLRLRLQRLAEATRASTEPAAPEPRPGPRRRRRPVLALPPSTSRAKDEVAAAAEAMEEAERSLQPPPALRLIGDRLGLSTFERQVLLLCAAMELDTRTPELCRAAHGQPYPTFALALALLDDPAWDVLSPERPLRYWHLVEVHQPASQPLTTSPLRADERIVSALKGLTFLDDRIGPLLQALDDPPTLELPPSQREVVAMAVGHLRRNHDRPWPVLQLVGTDRDSLRLVAQSTAHALGLPLYHLPVENVPGQGGDLENLARLWHRENLLGPASLYLEALELDASSPAQSTLLRFLSRSDGIVFLATRDVSTALNRPSHVLDVGRPTPAEQLTLWQDLLRDEAFTSPERLAAQFDLDVTAIHSIAQQELENPDPAPLQHRLWDACRRTSRPRLDSLAQRVDAKATWDRLVLPVEQFSLLHEIAAQVRQRHQVYERWGFATDMNRGLGISAMFTGESGTGKTMAAEVIANDLELDLYRIDLSSVVDKYIGETEKNLRRLFDAAENGAVILFFDEADALFGKRSEIKDAHDRYANIEINYLLQRMEGFGGLAILATNMKSAIDSAFLRRMRFVVDFPFPKAADRRRMWEHAFPVATPTEGLDLDRLARINLTGANIQNAALNAAFLAANRGHPVGMREVLQAVRNELRKLERPINEAEFRWDTEVAPA